MLLRQEGQQALDSFGRCCGFTSAGRQDRVLDMHPSLVVVDPCQASQWLDESINYLAQTVSRQ